MTQKSTKFVYAKQDVAIISNPSSHPAYGADEFRRQSFDQLETQPEPTIFLSKSEGKTPSSRKLSLTTEWVGVVH
ncbi:MAG: hypothetical protein J07HQW2_00305 [Haloquadratum walsbyi J07HQW2]|jgi:hypothetical protein|uniref:Uncharacterized protein n=1 Tax=Haloquadratum walsbyi J07HQW2 TaxID=1238425 RepID=U1PNP9_9EURY|nr:MAG: hypothetical protein J07HQW2_00305 [Haloquadratum walsbyi J07HQW2]